MLRAASDRQACYSKTRTGAAPEPCVRGMSGFVGRLEASGIAEHYRGRAFDSPSLPGSRQNLSHGPDAAIDARVALVLRDRSRASAYQQAIALVDRRRRGRRSACAGGSAALRLSVHRVSCCAQ